MARTAGVRVSDARKDSFPWFGMDVLFPVKCAWPVSFPPEGNTSFLRSKHVNAIPIQRNASPSTRLVDHSLSSFHTDHGARSHSAPPRDSRRLRLAPRPSSQHRSTNRVDGEDRVKERKMSSRQDVGAASCGDCSVEEEARAVHFKLNGCD
jgi:hypothetical protein